MRVLFSGDVAWDIGRASLETAIPILKREYGSFDFIVINCENAAHGKGMTRKIFDGFLALGVDAMTSGNHIWDKPDFYSVLDEDDRVLRPANYHRSCPGQGYVIAQRKGKKLGVVSLQGQAFMPPIDSPFTCADDVISQLKAKGGDSLPILVDFHAEATSEKIALARYLDGRVSAVVGTHTHVQTADEQVLPRGTAFICDAGMTGGHGGLIGVTYESAINKFLAGLPVKFEPCYDLPAFNGVIIDIDDESGLAKGITRINLPLSGG